MNSKEFDPNNDVGTLHLEGLNGPPTPENTASVGKSDLMAEHNNIEVSGDQTEYKVPVNIGRVSLKELGDDRITSELDPGVAGTVDMIEEQKRVEEQTEEEQTEGIHITGGGVGSNAGNLHNSGPQTSSRSS